MLSAPDCCQGRFLFRKGYKMRQYIVDAFADRVFEGNPAAVCVLDRWPEEDRMMRITRENNLSETAFAVPEGEGTGCAGLPQRGN